MGKGTKNDLSKELTYLSGFFFKNKQSQVVLRFADCFQSGEIYPRVARIHTRQ